ncbi:VOC family protein [Humitalea sp. 24SJ18S-53]|uniref:VOC family protein n=1 Tax=Humitalea sp. 24SJ18S-53 TaxID=3422307 RepID=UPI003D673CCF
MRITRLHHVAIAVSDMGPLDAILGDAFGLPAPHREHRAASSLDIAVYPIGESAVELLRPQGPGSSVPAFIAEKGEGLFHICLEVEDIDAAMAELRAKGLRFRTEAPMQGHAGTRVAFLDPATTGGVLFELLQQAHAG